MNNTFSQPAWKLPWEAVATIVEARLFKHLHVPIRCKAVREDEHYWSIQRLEGVFTREDITHLLQAESAPPATVHSELSMESSSSRALSMELSSLLLQHELRANWEFEYLTSEALWLLGYQKCSEQNDDSKALHLHLSNLDIPLSELKSREELLSFLQKHGADYDALMDFCDGYLDCYNNCLFWHYPISDGKHLGTYLVLVREGILSLPYDDKNDVPCGQFLLEDAALFRTVEEMQCFINDWRHFDADLTQAMYAMKDLLQQQEVEHREAVNKEH